nr:restriction endonuclease subunit S [uncultured Ligilactobacillus sp.]
MLWEQRNLLTVCYREDNKRKPVKRQDRKKGLTPYYGANGVQGYVSGYTHNGNYILIAEDGANDIKNYPISFVTGKIWANNHTHVLKINIKNNDGNFLVGTIKKINYFKYLVGSGRYKLTMESLSQINIWITSFPEQRKIGIVLNNINKLITLYERIIRVKSLKIRGVNLNLN